MKQSAYKKQVEKDLDRWIDEGWVPAESRAPILDSLPVRQTGDGRSWIVMAATVLAGLAVIAFIADNWSAIPRGLKLVILLSSFLGSAYAAALTYAGNKKLSNALSLLATLIFSGSIALIGQAYNMPGEPSGAIMMSAIAGVLIGLVGRSEAAGFGGFVFGVIWMGMSLDDLQSPWLSSGFWTINLLAVLIAVNAYYQDSRSLWHTVIIAVLGLSFIHVHQAAHLLVFGTFDLSDQFIDDSETSARMYFTLALLVFAAGWSALGWLGYRRDHTNRTGGLTLLGYAAWAVLASVALLALPLEEVSFLHRLIWLAASIFTLWFGARERYGWVAAAGIVSLLTAISVIFIDLGLELSAAAVIFAIAALASLAIVFVMKRKGKPQLKDAR